MIVDSVATTLNGPVTITIYGKLADKSDNKEKIKTLVDKVKAALPKKLEVEQSPQKPSSAVPHH